MFFQLMIKYPFIFSFPVMPHIVFFGCAYFVNILFPRKEKLSLKFVKCVFLMYSGSKRKYHVYSLELHRASTSMNVKIFSPPYLPHPRQ